MTVYLTADWLVTTGLIIGVWTLVALAVGIGVGKAIHIADERDAADDATWLLDQPDGRTDTREIRVPWSTRSTFDELA